jgi:glucosamine--fructose-6-phosphate aminotransferase (isomerizing)
MARCNWHSGDADLNGYVDYMAKEIDEQPTAAARVLDELGGGVVNGTLWSDLGLAPFDRLQIIGCGTSLNAGSVIANVVRRLGGMTVTRTVASEAADEVVEPGTLCLSISQSGETADVLRALDVRNSDGPV